MQVIFTARHCDVPDALRERAEQLVARVAKVARRPQHAEVVFNAENQRKLVELIMQLPRSQTLVATAEGDDFRSALDQAAQKLRQQAERAAADRAVRRAQTG